MKLRLALTNQHFLHEQHRRTAKSSLSGNAEAIALRHRQELFLDKDPTEISFSQMHGFNNGHDDGMTCYDCCKIVCIEGVWENAHMLRTCECFNDAVECYAFTLLAPYDILSALITVFLPIIAFCTTPYEKTTSLQVVLTTIYFVSFLIVIILSIYVYKYFRMNGSVFAPISSYKAEAVDKIIATWKDFLSTRIRNDIINQYFQELGPTVIEFCGDRHRVYDPLWVPDISWKSYQVTRRYTDWKYTIGPIEVGPIEVKQLAFMGKKIYAETEELVLEDKESSKGGEMKITIEEVEKKEEESELILEYKEDSASNEQKEHSISNDTTASNEAGTSRKQIYDSGVVMVEADHVLIEDI